MNWEKRQKFSIRKFAVGAASVVIGQFFVGQNLGDQAVSADEVAGLVDESSSADTGQSPAQPSSVSVSEATEASVVETAPAATSAGESTGNKEVSAAHAETATSASTEAVVGAAERAATPAVSNTGAQEATTPAVSNTGAQEATKDLTQAETVRYKVSYVDENGQVIYTTVKEAIIQAGQESVTVTEDGRELANEAALANYGDESGNSLVHTATITRGGTTEIVYQVKAFANPEAATNTGSREAKIDYTIVYKDKQTDVEVYRETKSYTQSTYDTKLTTDHLIQPDIQGIAELKGYKLLEASKVAHLTEGQPNLLVFALESLVKKEREKRADNPNTQPYITLEDYTRITRAKQNGTSVDLNYKVGLTRITSDEVELTEDAKALGLTYNKVNEYISGTVPLDGTHEARTYTIGLFSKKDPSLRKTFDFTIENPKSTGITSFNSGYGVGKRSVDISGAAYGSGDPGENRTGVYGATAPVTTFGYSAYYNQTIKNLNATSPRYVTEFGLYTADSRFITDFPKGPIRILSVERLDKTPGVNYEFLKVGDEYGQNGGGWDAHSADSTPYRIRFTEMPATQGDFQIRFKTTDSLHQSRIFTLNVTTYERSIGEGYLTNADVDFQADKQTTVLSAQNIPQVPRTDQEQTLGKLVLNKVNARIELGKLPQGLVYDAATQTIKKQAGVELNLGIYSFEARAIDGHFADNAPNRTFKFEVTDVINPIKHQVWTEGERFTPIPVSLSQGTEIVAVRVTQPSQTYAVGTGNSANKTVEGYGLVQTSSNQTARVEVDYRNAEGNLVTTYRDFTYEVRPNPVKLELAVTNHTQSIKEGENFLDMAITHTEGATLTVDTSALPRGTQYNPTSKTISGPGLVAGEYKITVKAEKGLQVAQKEINLTITRGELTAPNFSREVTVGDRIEDILLPVPANTERTIYLDHSLHLEDLYPYGLWFNDDKNILSGSTRKVGNLSLTYTLTRGGETARGKINIKIKGRPISVNSGEQTLVVGSPIQNFKLEFPEWAALGDSEEHDEGFGPGYKFVERPLELPPGLTYDKATRTISGTLTKAGTFTVNYTVGLPESDGNPTATGTFTLHVTDKPISVNSGEQTVVAGSDMTPFKIVASEGAEIHFDEGNTVPYRYRLPSGVDYNSETRTLSGKAMTVGDFTINYTVSYPGLDSAPARGSFTLHVTDKPISVNSDEQTVVAGSEIKPFKIVASEGAEIKFNIDGGNELYELPLDLSISGINYDSVTKTFSGKALTVGDNKIYYTVYYPGLVGTSTDKGSFTLHVTDKPISVTGGERTVPVTTKMEDLTLTVSEGATISGLENLPDGLRYDAKTHTISGTPTTSGNYRFAITASYPGVEGNSTASSEVVINVLKSPASIEIAKKDQTIVLGEAIAPAKVSHNAASTVTLKTPYGLVAEDEITNVLKDYGLSYDPVTQTISGTPVKTGTISIRMQATNPKAIGGESAQDRMTITVNPKIETQLDLTVDNARQLLVRGNSIETIQLHATTGAKIALDSATLPAGVSYDEATQTISGTPTKKGSYTTKVTATLGDKTISKDIVIDVIEFKNGENGKSPTVTAERGTNEVNGTTITGTWVTITPAGGGTPSRTFIPDGKNGVNGRDGVNGQTISVVTSKDGDTTTIKFYVDSNGNGEHDNDEPIIRTAVIKDGKAGADGKSPTVTTERGTNTVDGKEVNGTWVIVTPADGGTPTRTFVADGAKGEKGDKGENGADGKSPTVTTERGTNTVDGKEVNGTWLVVTPADGGTPTRTFVADGAKGEKGDKGETGANGAKGEDGKNGVDGKSPTVTTERGTNTVDGKEVNGTWVVVTPADGGTPTRTFVADGAKG